MHHLVEEGEVFGLKLARLTKHSGYGRIGVAGQEVFPDERGDRNAEVIGEPCDEGHRRIVRPTFLEFPDMRLGELQPRRRPVGGTPPFAAAAG